MPDLTKVEIPNTVSKVDVVFTWEQPQKRGLFGKAEAMLNRTDVDVSVITFAGRVPVDYVSPKDHPYAHGGRVIHSGDVKRGTGEGGGETVKLELANIRQEDSDLTSFAVVASCATGNFSKIAGASARLYDAETNTQLPGGVIRFDVTTERTGALLAIIRKTDAGWVVEPQSGVYGEARDWKDLAGLAKQRV